MSGEIYTTMEYRKFLSEKIVAWSITTTYLWYADYKATPTKIDGYVQDSDKSRAIWRIKKIVDDGTTKTTETFYPEGWPEKTFARTDRATLTYV